jgi:hypothetical protein
MKTLIIHPQDPTTRFLCGIYDTIPNKTVIDSGITKDQLRKKIDEHDRILMMGHGSTAGLFSVGRFPGAYPYIIDDSMVELLQNRITIYIWCNADKFVQRNCLYGFYTGMFISEVDEALYFNFWNLNDLEHLIEESNYGFSSIVAKHLNEGLFDMYKNVVAEYGLIARHNPIARFNLDRLYLHLPTKPLVSGKDFNITQYDLQHGRN